MKIFRASGFVLNRRNLGEADRLVTIFSKEFGKIKVLAKGSRKLKAKNIGKLEPYYLINFQFIRGNSFNILTSVEIIQPYEFINNKASTNIIKLISKYTPDEQSDPKIFWLLEESLQALSKTSINILPYFKLNFWFTEGLIDPQELVKSSKKLDQVFYQIINSSITKYLSLISSTQDKNKINRLEKAVDLLESTIKPN